MCNSQSYAFASPYPSASLTSRSLPKISHLSLILHYTMILCICYKYSGGIFLSPPLSHFGLIRSVSKVCCMRQWLGIYNWTLSSILVCRVWLSNFLLMAGICCWFCVQGCAHSGEINGWKCHCLWHINLWILLHVQVILGRGYVENVSLSNLKMVIGVITCAIALAAQFYPKKFPENKNFLIGCIILYPHASTIYLIWKVFTSTKMLHMG